MKALTVRQPWAWAIVHGTKRIENRSRHFSHRGPLLIHAGLSRAELGKLGWQPPAEHLAFGALIGVVEVVDCVPLAQVEGDEWAEGPHCLILRNPRPIAPIAWKGSLGLFEVPGEANPAGLTHHREPLLF
jgi:hypothetical protein